MPLGLQCAGEAVQEALQSATGCQEFQACWPNDAPSRMLGLNGRDAVVMKHALYNAVLHSIAIYGKDLIGVRR